MQENVTEHVCVSYFSIIIILHLYNLNRFYNVGFIGDIKMIRQNSSNNWGGAHGYKNNQENYN